MRRLCYACGCLLLATSAFAQTSTSSEAAQEPPASAVTQPASGAPTVQFRGFADINFAATDTGTSDDGRLTDGFSLGYLVAHVSASLGGKFSFYGETTVSPRLQSLGYTIDIARAILRYDYNDRFKISVGRYHLPSATGTRRSTGGRLEPRSSAPISSGSSFSARQLSGRDRRARSCEGRRGYTVGYGSRREGDLLLAGDLGGKSVTKPGWPN